MYMCCMVTITETEALTFQSLHLYRFLLFGQPVGLSRTALNDIVPYESSIC